MMMLRNTSDNLRVVFDTNIFIAAFLRPGLSEELVDRLIDREFDLFSSPDLINELVETLREKPILTRYSQQDFINTVKRTVRLVYPTEKVLVIKRDPDDNRVLECALAAKAKLIVTLDKDLLDLKTWQGVTITHPKTFSWIIPKNES